MTSYKFTEYFEKEVLLKRSYLKKKWCIQVIEDPIKVEKQEDNRYRFWGQISELDYDKHGNLVGIDIDNASKKLEMDEFSFKNLPFKKEFISG